MNPQTVDTSSASAPATAKGRQISASAQATPNARSSSSRIVAERHVQLGGACRQHAGLVLPRAARCEQPGQRVLRRLGALEPVHRVSLAVRLRGSGVRRQVRRAVSRVRANATSWRRPSGRPSRSTRWSRWRCSALSAAWSRRSRTFSTSRPTRCRPRRSRRS